MHASVRAALTAAQFDDPAGRPAPHLSRLLDAAPDGCLRAHAPGHLTASALVVDADRDARTAHPAPPRVGKWVQLGGIASPTMSRSKLPRCAKPSRSPASKAYGSRTAQCTCTHPITCSLGVPTRHLDVRFVAVAPPTPDGVLPGWCAVTSHWTFGGSRWAGPQPELLKPLVAAALDRLA